MEHQTLGRWVVRPSNPATHHIISKIVEFYVCYRRFIICRCTYRNWILLLLVTAEKKVEAFCWQAIKASLATDLPIVGTRFLVHSKFSIFNYDVSFLLSHSHIGQLISKGHFDVIVSTKKTTKFAKDFCPKKGQCLCPKKSEIIISLIRGYLIIIYYFFYLNSF